MILLLPVLLACARPAAPPLPEHTRAEGVRAALPGGQAAAASVSVDGDRARTSEVSVVAGAALAAEPPASPATTSPTPASPPAAPAPAAPAPVDPARALTIDAPASEWDLRERVARFEGGVVATRGPVTLRTPTLTVRYAGADRIDKVEAAGGVEVTRGARTARAERAVLDAASGEIVLTGGPRLAEGPNALEGTRIVLFLDDERARCEGAEGAPCRLVVDGTALR